MIQNFPRPINPKVKKQTDDQVAKLGQLNQLVRDINNLNVGGTAYTGIPFEWYPPASLVNEGPKFTYDAIPGDPNGRIELISYHIKGIQQITSGGSFETYLCTVSLKDPFVFPGSITGMFLNQNVNGNVVTTPLANGGLVEVNGDYVPVSNFQMNLYPYNNNPQQDGSLWYALLISATTEFVGPLSALIAYDFEMLLPNFVQAPTVFQD